MADLNNYGETMTKLYTVANSSRKTKHIYANDELHAAQLAVDSGLGRKTQSMKVKLYDMSKHKQMEQHYLMLLECRDAVGEMKRNPTVKGGNISNSDEIYDYDGCFAVLKINS